MPDGETLSLAPLSQVGRSAQYPLEISQEQRVAFAEITGSEHGDFIHPDQVGAVAGASLVRFLSDPGHKITVISIERVDQTRLLRAQESALFRFEIYQAAPSRMEEVLGKVLRINVSCETSEGEVVRLDRCKIFLSPIA